MGMKEWFMDRQMKNMSKEEKQTMMNTMMDKFFASMTREEKKELMNTMMPKMMDNMFKGMTNKEKQEIMLTMMPMMMENMFAGMDSEATSEMMMSMMPKMMTQMFGGGKPVGGKKGKTQDMPMEDMMKMCMGDHEPPWISMEKAFHKAMNATEYSMLSTEEINSLFKDWINQTNNKILTLVQETQDPKTIAKKLNLSEKSVYYTLCKLAQEGKINLNIVARS